MAGRQEPTKGNKNGAGRKPFVPDEKQRLTVSIMAACGMPHGEITKQIINPSTNSPISRQTLETVFRDELDNGKAKANAMVAQSLFKRATSGSGPGAVAAMIFWLKTQARWREHERVDDLKDEDDIPPEPKQFTYNVIDGRQNADAD